MGRTVFVIVITSIIAVLVGLASTYFIKLVEPNDAESIKAQLSADEVQVEEDDKTILDRTVEAITVSDFSNLLSKQNILAVMVFSILVGIAMNMSGDKAKPIERVLISASDVIMDVSTGLSILWLFSSFMDSLIIRSDISVDSVEL